MGLSLCVGMKPQKRFFFSKSESFASIIERIALAAGDYLKEKNLARIAHITVDQDAMAIGIHPAEEDMYFHVASDHLVCEAKTSSAGPGYHAFVVDLLTEIEKRCHFKWDWDNETLGFGDETGYDAHRDFEMLQDAMLSYFQGLCNLLANQDDSKSLSLSLPMNFGIEHTYFAISPMGTWEKAFFKSALEDASLLHDKAEVFFPWWHRAQDALFWKNVGLVKMWTQVKWHPAYLEGDEDEQLLTTTLECFEKARHLSHNTIPLPEEEIEEMRALRTGTHCPIPNPDLMGFYRLNCRTPLTGRWSIVIPGYFYNASEEGDSCVTWSHIGKSVFSSSHIMEPGVIPPFMKDEELGDPVRVFNFEKDTCIGMAELRYAPASEGGYPMLICQVAAPGSMSMTHIAVDTEEDIEWAVGAFKSIEPLASYAANPN